MFDKMRGFLKETKQELNKVSWPEKNELVGSTMVVIVTTLLMALFIGIIDFILSFVIRVVIR